NHPAAFGLAGSPGIQPGPRLVRAQIPAIREADGCTDRSVVQETPRRSPRRDLRKDEVDGMHDAGAIDGIERPLGVAETGCDRLLAEHVLAAQRSFNDDSRL